jgi:hypothetical protein
MSLFRPRHEVERESRIPAVIEEIHAYGLAHQGSTRDQIIQQFSYLYFGEFMQKHFRSLIDELVKSGRAEIPFIRGVDKGEKPIARLSR